MEGNVSGGTPDVLLLAGQCLRIKLSIINEHMFDWLLYYSADQSGVADYGIAFKTKAI